MKSSELRLLALCGIMMLNAFVVWRHEHEHPLSRDLLVVDAHRRPLPELGFLHGRGTWT